jgi:CheY-like chemotaxis protein
MEITGNEAVTAGYADEAESRSPAKRLLDYAFRPPAVKPRRVLVIDDDPTIRMLCAVNLGIEGVVVLEAPNGNLGLEQARSEHPDLVVTDVMMPGLDGFELAEALRRDERTREIPLIFLSSEADPANADRARSAHSPT